MRARTWTGALVIAALVAVAAAAVVTRAGAREEAREIHLVARGMAFFIDGDATANPTIRVKSGERIRFVVRNETAGMEHDLAIASLGAAITPLATGASAMLDLQAPSTPGTHEYVCRPHSVMMRGRLVVGAGL